MATGHATGIYITQWRALYGALKTPYEDRNTLIEQSAVAKLL